MKNIKQPMHGVIPLISYLIHTADRADGHMYTISASEVIAIRAACDWMSNILCHANSKECTHKRNMNGGYDICKDPCF